MLAPLNIGVYSHYFTPEIGAPSARIYDLGQQWLAAGHNVRVATCVPNHPTGQVYPGYKTGWQQQEVLDGIEVQRNWSYITPNSGFVKKTLGHVSFIPSSRINQGKFGAMDAIIGTSPTPFAALAGLLTARKRKVPFIMEIRDLWPAIFTEMGIINNRQIIRVLEMGEMWLYRQATQIVTVTEAFRQDLIRRNVPAEKITTIPNGADTDFWQPQDKPQALAKQLGLENKFVVLYIGAHGISHALEKIVDAAKALEDQPEIQFLFVGEGSRKAAVQDYAAERGVQNITFLGSTDKQGVKDYYALADVCLVPLRDIPLFDGFIPSKMFEIMAMARPIVASLKGEAAAILERANGAKIVPPEDSGAIKNAIAQLYADRQMATELGQNGRTFVEQHYSRRLLANQYLDVVRTAIDQYSG